MKRKRFVTVLVSLLLILCGCRESKPQQTVSATTAEMTTETSLMETIHTENETADASTHLILFDEWKNAIPEDAASAISVSQEKDASVTLTHSQLGLVIILDREEDTKGITGINVVVPKETVENITAANNGSELINGLLIIASIYMAPMTNKEGLSNGADVVYNGLLKASSEDVKKLTFYDVENGFEIGMYLSSSGKFGMYYRLKDTRLSDNKKIDQNRAEELFSEIDEKDLDTENLPYYDELIESTESYSSSILSEKTSINERRVPHP